MRPTRLSRGVAPVLWLLFVVDAVLAVVAAFFPGLWFQLLHGGPVPVDSLYFHRTGAQWAGFALVEGIAVVRWKRNPAWVVAVAGVRLCDIFTDMTALFLMGERTVFGEISLALTGPFNLAVAILLFLQAKAIAATPAAR